ncbi:hypothetical protein F5882DRAFT_90006 [Hyaloscypha sp. PMI_1271]|nr:hypothetical protein F5882DRAFT_90006 [Hyaloscypha sp. PMI_1271]
MERFITSCDQAASFPKNLLHHDVHMHKLNEYLERLDTREVELFSDEGNGKLALMVYNVQTRESQSSVISSLLDLKAHISRSAPSASDSNPITAFKFLFLTAPNSRERLYASRELLTYILSYHQVMPAFLDFLFPFGSQEGPRDMNFSSFREDSRLDPSYGRLELPELGRSGRELRMCYNLKSVEPNNYEPELPWTIRQAAVYHSLDTVTGNALWVIVKGNKLIKERIEAAADLTETNVDDLDSQSNPFAVSLATHTIISDWCSDTWRWYLIYLEERLSQKTGYFFAVKVQQAATARPPAGNHPGTPSVSSRSEASISSPFSNHTQFSFDNFLEVQTIEDRANEIRLMLESNIDILKRLREHYSAVVSSKHCPQDLISGCQPQIEKFGIRISGIISNLQTQQLRTTNLLRLVADRKNLLYAILQFQDIEASNALALRAHESSQNMELMTMDMHILARKTKSETVSMRIITLVTLFFLPGTFISASISALKC